MNSISPKLLGEITLYDWYYRIEDEMPVIVGVEKRAFYFQFWYVWNPHNFNYSLSWLSNKLNWSDDNI